MNSGYKGKVDKYLNNSHRYHAEGNIPAQKNSLSAFAISNAMKTAISATN